MMKAIIALMLMAGCKGPQNTGIGNLALAAQQQMDCCANKLEISFFDSSTAGDYYCQIGVKNGGQLLGLGPLHIMICPASSKQCDITVDYSMIHASGNYDFYVYVYSDSYDCGDIKKAHHTSSALSVYISTSDWDTANCHATCCTKARKYVVARRQMDGLIGAKANILTRYGKLCHENEGIDTAFSTVYISINNTIHDTYCWAQTGYIKIRPGGSNDYIIGRYFEINGAAGHLLYVDSIYHHSFEGLICNYQIELDKSSGTWHAYYDGNEWFIWENDTLWQDTTGADVQWNGEIYNYETDMAGTQSNPCIIDACSLKTDNTGYKVAGFEPEDLRSSEFNEWYIELISNGEVHLWDQNPQN